MESRYLTTPLGGIAVLVLKFSNSSYEIRKKKWHKN